MDRQDDRNPLLGLIRLPGLMVVLFVALAGAPSETTARSTCQDYTIEECVSSGSCLEVAGRPCGEQAPGCAGMGWIVCGLGNCDGTDVAQVCQFGET